MLALNYSVPDHSDINMIRNREEGITPRSHSSLNNNSAKLSIEGKDELFSSSDNTNDF